VRDFRSNCKKDASCNTEWDDMGVFAIFDGHCGNQASRYAAEKIPLHLEVALSEGIEQRDSHFFTKTQALEEALSKAFANTDNSFCNLCTTDGRNWECGSTALVALVIDDDLVVANLGDCRGVICGSSIQSDDLCESSVHSELNGWMSLVEGDEQGWKINRDNANCFWKDVVDIHSPLREDEKLRIEKANGWVTVEQDVCIGQLKRLDLYDEDVMDILKRCFSDRLDDKSKNSVAPGRLLEVGRVCGELAVSRALGDRDFKSSFNPPSSLDFDCTDNNKHQDSLCWKGPDFLPYYTQQGHNSCFYGDLVSAEPEIQTLKVGRKGVFDEFLLLACDGLWDVMEVDDAVRVARGLLFEKHWTARKAAARLAELAIQLGSSDNITVILIRFFRV